MSLEALERSDLSRLPGGIFTRSFIRAYAQEVGLDPDRTIQDFIAELPPDAATATTRPVAVEDGERLESDRRAMTTAIRLILVSVPIVGLVMYLGTHRMSLDPDDVTSAPQATSEPSSQPIEEVVSQVVPEVLAAPPEDAAALPAVATATSDLTLEMVPRASCWVSVTADGELVFSGLMAAGARRTVTAKEQILLNVNDAGVFDYTLNGRQGRPLGAPGEVVSKRITVPALHEFVSP
jgi:cytoskeletal protein RodZ